MALNLLCWVFLLCEKCFLFFLEKKSKMCSKVQCLKRAVLKVCVFLCCYSSGALDLFIAIKELRMCRHIEGNNREIKHQTVSRSSIFED